MGPPRRVDHRVRRAHYAPGLSPFAEHLDFGEELCAEPLDEVDEEKLLTSLSNARTPRQPQRAMRQSVVLGLTGLDVAKLGYVIEKLFFGT